MNANRWWIYQRERFPLLSHGLLIAMFSYAALSYSFLLRTHQTAESSLERFSVPSWGAAVVGFCCCLLFFLQLRIADEFKDFQDDCRYRPERPVPRGLVTLRELGVLFAIGALLQLLLTAWLSLSLVLLLAAVWAYLAMMSQEFFLGDWLKARPALYLISHMVIMPLIDLFATACDWWPTWGQPPLGLHWLITASFFNGIVIELGRKIYAPVDERTGVPTYSSLWGRTTACSVWLAMMLATAGFALAAAAQLGHARIVAGILMLAVLLASLAVGRFLREPTTARARQIEKLSGLWTLLMYGSLGLGPLVARILVGAS